jgi:hypothetical protein
LKKSVEFPILYLKPDQQPDVLNMNRGIWNGPLEGIDVSVPQIQEAPGDYFVFEAAHGK